MSPGPEPKGSVLHTWNSHGADGYGTYSANHGTGTPNLSDVYLWIASNQHIELIESEIKF